MKQRKKSFGMRISAFVLSFAMVCTLLAGVNVVAFAADDNDLIVSVHSFYNDATKGGDGEHLYTKDLDEMSWLSSLPTWNDEDEAWKAPVSSSLAVYRVYNPNSGEHHYAAADEAEWLVSQGWTQEKIAFYSDDNKGVPIYRLWNGGEGVGSHYYTTDEGEAAYLASIGWTAEGVNFYGVKEEEPGEKEMTAAQTGADEITVVSETEFAGTEEFTVTTALGEEAAEFVFLDENTVVITLESPIVETEYTVTCSDIEYEPASFVGEEAEVTNLVFADDQLVLNANGTEGTVGYSTVDQFGDPIDDTVEFKAGAYQAVGLAEDGKGVLTISNSGAAIAVGTKIPVAAIYAGGTKVVNETFEVAATSVVADMQVMDLIVNPLDEDIQEELAGKRITSSRLEVGNYFLPVIATDQYGNVLTAAQLNGMLDSTLYVQPNTEWVLGSRDAYGLLSVVNSIPMIQGDGDVFIEGEGGVVLVPVASNGKSSGVGAISFLSIAGFTTTKNVQVEQNEIIDTINVTIGDVVAEQPSPIGITATNQYGEAIDFEEDGNSIAVAGGDVVLTYNGDDSSTIDLADGIFMDGTVLEVPGVIFAYSMSDTGVDFMTISPASKKVSVKQINVKPAAVPTKVQGVDPTKETVIGGAVGNLDFTEEGSFIFKDQYGAVVGPTSDFVAEPTYTNNIEMVNVPEDTTAFFYTITPPTATTYTTLTNGVVTKKVDAVGPGSDKYTVTLWRVDDVDNVQVNTEIHHTTFTATLAGDPVTFNAVTDPTQGLLYVGAGSTDFATVGVYGTDAKGNTFLMTPDKYSLTVDSGLAVTGSAITGRLAGDPGTKEGEANVNVYVKGKVVASTTVSYSNATPVAMGIMAYECDDLTVANPVLKPITSTTIVGLPTMRITTDGPLATCSKVVIYNAATAGDKSGYVIAPYTQYMQPIAGTEVTLLDSDGCEITNTAGAINENVDFNIVTAEDDFIVVVIENGNQNSVFTIAGVTVDNN